MIELTRLEFTVAPWVFDVLTHLWQSTLVALVVLGGLMLGRKLSARTRRTLGWIAVAKFALPTAWLTRAFIQTDGGRSGWIGADLLVLPVTMTSTSTPTSQVDAVSVASLLLAAWAIGSVLLLGWWFARAVRVRRRILAATILPSAEVSRRLAHAAASVGLARPPICAVVSAEHPPAVIGILTPRVILPQGLEEALTSAELESILIHECLHVRRRDNLGGAIRAVFVAAFWFNPVAWLLARTLAIETEKACDEGVLEITDDADAYARGIVASVKHTLGLVSPGVSGVATPPVLGRIKSILSFHHRSEHRFVRRLTLTTSLALVALSGFTGSVAAGQAEASKPTRYKIGAIAITFTGPTTVTEESVRAQLELRPGGELDEKTLDRSIRALYRLDRFKMIETKYEPAAEGTYNLSFILTPKMTEGTAEGPTAPSGPSLELSQAAEEEYIRQQQLAEARSKLERASERLKKLREERAAALAKKNAADAEASRASPPPAEIPSPSAPVASASPVASAARAPRMWNGQRVFDVTELERQPEPRFQARPRYPFELRQAGVTGEVVVDFIVDPQGEVVDARTLRSSNPGFEAAAVAAVAKWKFRPGVKNGLNVPTHLQTPIIFTIDE